MHTKFILFQVKYLNVVCKNDTLCSGAILLDTCAYHLHCLHAVVSRQNPIIYKHRVDSSFVVFIDPSVNIRDKDQEVFIRKHYDTERG